MKKFFLTIVLSSVLLFTYGQDYKTAVGLRGGFWNGITVKHHISNEAAIEGLISTRWNGFNVTGLYEIHRYTLNAEGLNWYYGFGAHIGFYNNSIKSPWFKDDRDYVVIGGDFILGMQYTFPDFPINLSLDWKPMVNISGNTGIWGDGIALSVRYVIQ